MIGDVCLQNAHVRVEGGYCLRVVIQTLIQLPLMQRPPEKWFCVVVSADSRLLRYGLRQTHDREATTMVLNSLESCGSAMGREFDSLRFRQYVTV